MGQQVINIGAALDDGTGDPNRVAWDKTNQNFTELYNANATFLTAATAAITYQPLDATLTAFAAYNTNGLLTQTAADTFTGRTLTGPAAGIAISNGNGVSGNPTLALADDLSALEALSGTDTIYYRSGTSAWTAVTIGTNLTFSGGTLAASGGGTTVAVQTFTASGTYTPTSGMRYCIVECVGGGGGGGGIGNTSSNSIGAGGGGSGGYSRKIVSAATVGASQTVTIGAAGTAGAAGTGGNGGAGGTTSVGTLCIANGGSGGIGQNTGTYDGGAGGTASTGDIAAAGAPGQGGGLVGVGLVCPGGHGGSSSFGGGGKGATTSPVTPSSQVGGAASNYGSGGGGAAGQGVTTARTGGAGSAGFVIITEYL
jgi:hypothetical protein